MGGYYDRDRSGSAGTMHNHGGTYIGNTAEYLVSGWPFVYTFTGNSGNGSDSTKTVGFNYVTKFVQVTAHDGDVSLTINDSASSFLVPSGTTVRLDVKMTKLAITVGDTKTFSLVAGLTNVPAAQYPDDSWSGGSVT